MKFKDLGLSILKSDCVPARQVRKVDSALFGTLYDAVDKCEKNKYPGYSLNPCTFPEMEVDGDEPA